MTWFPQGAEETRLFYIFRKHWERRGGMKGWHWWEQQIISEYKNFCHKVKNVLLDDANRITRIYTWSGWRRKQDAFGADDPCICGKGNESEQLEHQGIEMSSRKNTSHISTQYRAIQSMSVCLRASNKASLNTCVGWVLGWVARSQG